MELGCGQGLVKGPDASEPGKMRRGAEIEKSKDPGGVERDGGQYRTDGSEGEKGGGQSETGNPSPGEEEEEQARGCSCELNRHPSDIHDPVCSGVDSLKDS